MRRVMVGLVAATAAFAAVHAAAASLTVTSDLLGAGSAGVSSCDADGVSTAYTTGFDATAGYTVTQVTVTGIASGCGGLAVRVTLANSANASVGGGGPVTVPGGGGSVVVPITGTVAVSAVNNVHVVISQP